jgi:YjbE family integral membrane protein
MIEFLQAIGIETQPQFWISVLQIIWINVLLSGDNAIVIALACRSLPPKQRLTGLVLGTTVALLLRLVFAGAVSTLMLLPYVKIVGGLALLWIAVKLLMPSEEGVNKDASSDNLWRAVKLIAIADVVMSLDNVIAVAAVADGNFALLVFGLGVSIPAIVGGANLIMVILNYFPIIIWAGVALLGWIAGEVLASDPVVMNYAASFGPEVPEKVKLTCGIVGMVGTVGACLINRARLAAAHVDR